MLDVEGLSGIQWQAPWEPVGSQAEALESELRKELGTRHPIYGRRIKAVARRQDNDDVLFLVAGGGSPLAVIHLTWSNSPETDTRFPWTTFYQSPQDFISKCMSGGCAG